MRVLYSLLWCLILPFALLRLWWRGRAEAGYRRHIGERLGRYAGAPRTAGAETIWLHAVSVGETRAAEPLIDLLLRQHPHACIVLTHMTPTGRAAGKALYAGHGERLQQAYLPYDIGFMARRFLRHFAPRCCILMETEVWPNMIAACNAAGVPVALVNARLSDKSLRQARRYGAVIREAAAGIAMVAAQTGEDAARIRLLGAAHVHVTGSMKFDVQVPDAARRLGGAMRVVFGERPVLLCASTREGEEALLLDALAAGLASAVLPADTLIVLVPRHPQRFDAVAELVAQRGLALVRRSALTLDGLAIVAPQVAVVLGDSMGEMFAYYFACDLAFIGGSLLPLGGQNLIEAMALAKPVLTGPHTFNFAAITGAAVAAGAALCVDDADQLAALAGILLHDAERRAAIGASALAFALARGGATLRTAALLHPLLAAPAVKS